MEIQDRSQKFYRSLESLPDRDSGHAVNGHVRFTPKTDVCGAVAHVGFGPKADIARSFVSHQDRWRSKVADLIRSRLAFLLRLSVSKNGSASLLGVIGTLPVP